MHAVDHFVFFDDVQYINRGWVNRNRVLLNGAASWLTFPVHNADARRAINQTTYLGGPDTTRAASDKVTAAYRKAPFFADVFAQFAALLAFQDANVAAFNAHHLAAIARRIGIRCRFSFASELELGADVKGQSRVLEICRRLGATRYLNAIGGLALYDAQRFADSGVELAFVRARPIEYPQLGATHVPFLSIIDVLMFNGFAGTATLLSQYDLVEPQRS
jgi:hypothetical protein